MKKISNSLLWITAIVVILATAYVIYNKTELDKIGQEGTSTSSFTQDTLQRDITGQTKSKQLAPEIKLSDLDGNIVKLSDYKGKVVVINFWASWCPPCREEMPELNQASLEFSKDDKAVLLTVNLTDGVRETVEKAKKYMSDNNYNMKVLLDTEGKAASDYYIKNIPTTFIINQEGEIFDYIIGPTTKDYLVNYVNLLTNENN